MSKEGDCYIINLEVSMENHWYWKNNDFFENLDKEKIKFLNVAQKMEIDKNTMIFFEEDSGDCCFYLAKGLVRIFSVADSGKEPVFFLRRQGDLFGLSEVLGNVPRKANAQALTNCECYKITSTDLEKLLQENYLLARRIISLLGARIRYLGDYVSNLMTCTVKVRLIKLLIALIYDSISSAEDWDKPISIPIRISQEQLASMTGSTQPTISDLLQELQKDGIITVSRKQLCVCKPYMLLNMIESCDI